METSETSPSKIIICRPFITVKGKRIYASAYGKAAFCFPVDAVKGETKIEK